MLKPYYENEHGKLYCGDCMEVLPALIAEGVKVDAVVTDPPYGIDVGANQSAQETRPGLLVKGSYDVYDDTPENYLKVVVPAIRAALEVAQRGAVFGFTPNIYLLPTPDVIGGVFVPAGCGRNRWGWTTFMPVLLYGCAPDLEKGARPTAIKSVATAEKNGHPTPKPTEWFNWLIGLASRPSETILDPFAGSGTTLVAAQSLGRKWIGIEISQAYCDIAVKRLEGTIRQIEGQLSFFEPPETVRRK